MQIIDFINACEHISSDRITIKDASNDKTVYKGTLKEIKLKINNYNCIWVNDLVVSWVVEENEVIVSIDINDKYSANMIKEMALNHELRENEKYPDRNMRYE